jgi:hypothetical protein
MRNNNRYHGNYNNREKGNIFKHIEENHIYKFYRSKLYVNDTNIDMHNPIFETLLTIYTK